MRRQQLPRETQSENERQRERGGGREGGSEGNTRGNENASMNAEWMGIEGNRDAVRAQGEGGGKLAYVNRRDVRRNICMAATSHGPLSLSLSPSPLFSFPAAVDLA